MKLKISAAIPISLYDGMFDLENERLDKVLSLSNFSGGFFCEPLKSFRIANIRRKKFGFRDFSDGATDAIAAFLSGRGVASPVVSEWVYIKYGVTIARYSFHVEISDLSTYYTLTTQFENFLNEFTSMDLGLNAVFLNKGLISQWDKIISSGTDISLPKVIPRIEGSYLDLYTIELDNEEYESTLAGVIDFYKKRDGSIEIAPYQVDGVRSDLISSYTSSTFICNGNTQNGSIEEVLDQANAYWNMIRQLRDRVRDNYQKIYLKKYNTFLFKDVESRMREYGKSLQSLMYESESETVCEWSYDSNWYNNLWSAWRGDKMKRSTVEIIGSFANQIDREKSIRSDARQDYIQHILFAITIISFVGTAMQIMEYVNGLDKPSNLARIESASTFGLIFLITIAFYLRAKATGPR